MNNILITSAGRRVSLVRFFKKELNQIFPEAKVFTSDANPEFAAACIASDGFFKVPRVNESNYIEILLNKALELSVKLIIPTIDTELLLLSENKELFMSNGIDIVISDYEIVKVFRDKRLTHKFFESYNINVAKEYTKDNYQLPLYIKPYDGSRSVDNYVIKDKSQLTDYHFTNEKLMFLEYLDHNLFTEYTIDMYYDNNSNLKALIPRKRIEVRDGEVNKAVTEHTFFVDELIQKMSFVKGFRGCITFQVFVNSSNKVIYGIEINPRFGGGYPLSYLAGANFPKWLLQEYICKETSLPFYDGWEKNLMMLRYDDEVLVRNQVDK